MFNRVENQDENRKSSSCPKKSSNITNPQYQDQHHPISNAKYRPTEDSTLSAMHCYYLLKLTHTRHSFTSDIPVLLLSTEYNALLALAYA